MSRSVRLCFVCILSMLFAGASGMAWARSITSISVDTATSTATISCEAGEVGVCHTIARLVPVKEYEKTHPEYFAFRKEKGRRTNGQLCLTNPDVLEIVTSNVLKAIAGDPGARYYGISQNDNRQYCECPRCEAVDEEEGSHAGTNVRFVNAVAERVADGIIWPAANDAMKWLSPEEERSGLEAIAVALDGSWEVSDVSLSDADIAEIEARLAQVFGGTAK